MKQNYNYVDLTNQRIGRLTCTKDVGRSKDGSVLWECVCDCGNKIVATSRNLNRHHTKSCGCLQIDRVVENRTVHGLYHDENGKRAKLYHVWGMMRQRCKNPNNHAYKDYGGRGISVCNDWDCYKTFHDWANGNGYKDGLTIDRIDNDGDYEPSNCRWVTISEQQKNTRRNHYFELNGRSQTLTQWSKELGIEPHILSTRNRRGWSDERALTQPVRRRKNDNQVK